MNSPINDPRGWKTPFSKAFRVIAHKVLGPDLTGRGASPAILHAFEEVWSIYSREEQELRILHLTERARRERMPERLEQGALALCRRELVDLIPGAPAEVHRSCTKACPTCLAAVADILEVTDAIC